MKKYIKRLVECGISPDRAHKICVDFVTNLSILDLECFVHSIETKVYVDKV